MPTNKEANMKYFLEPQGDNHFAIGNYVSDCAVGYVALRGARYHVENDDGDEIAVVKSLDDAIPALAAYYEKNPPRWEPESDSTTYGSNPDAPARCGPRYIKETQFGPIWVDQVKSGWVAYRNHHELLIDGNIATFTTCEEAQRVADAHLRDGYPNCETINDGFSWRHDPDIEWWTDPYRIANRAGALAGRNSPQAKTGCASIAR
jgi:hypothetical protein